MTTRNGLGVGRTKTGDGKPWIVVWAHKDGSRVAFEDIFYQVRGIIQCEAEKYSGTQGWRMPMELFLRILGADVKRPEHDHLLDRYWERLKSGLEHPAEAWDALAEEFGLPKTDGKRPMPSVLLLDHDGREGA